MVQWPLGVLIQDCEPAASLAVKAQQPLRAGHCARLAPFCSENRTRNLGPVMIRAPSQRRNLDVSDCVARGILESKGCIPSSYTSSQGNLLEARPNTLGIPPTITSKLAIYPLK